MSVFKKVASGLTRSRDKFKEQMYALIGRGPNLDEDFWEELEEVLVLSDMGAPSAMLIVENLRKISLKENLADSYEVLDRLAEEIEASFAKGGDEIFGGDEAIILFVGINGTGKTTTVGKIAKEASDSGRKVILGSADTFRAAAIEQLQVWADRAGVEMVTRERGADPASVSFETVERAEIESDDLVLIDTAGRLHTSDDLMRELVKVVDVTRKRAKMPVYTVLVIDATTGQNGMQQAREFDRALELDGLIVTKLDGTAKGGIALAISHELDLPILKIGVGEQIDDLRDFDAHDYVAALIGDFEEDDFEEDELEEDELEESDSLESASAEIVENLEDMTPSEQSVEVSESFGFAEDAISKESTEESTVSAELAELSESEEEPKAMSWAEFVKLDDDLKAKEAEAKKKHFWEKW